MLNGADGCRGDESEASGKVKDADALFSKLKRWHRTYQAMGITMRGLWAFFAYFLFFGVAAAEVLSFRSEVFPSNFTATIKGDFALPSGNGPFPVVILLHPCSGLEPAPLAALQAHSRELLANGFATMILDSYGPRNLANGKACKTFSTGFLRRSDAFNAMAAVKSHAKTNKENIFLLGLSDGANAAIISARGGGSAGQCRAVAAYYPSCDHLSGGANYNSPAIVFVGEKDDWTPAAECTKTKSHNGTAGAEFKVYSYPNAHHGFDQLHERRKVLGHTLAFDRDATVDSRKKYIEFFKKYLTAKATP
jgi:dienelactone hydrolase